MRQGCVIWLTGLPSSGKTTLAHLLEAALSDRSLPVERLDGDEVRMRLGRGLGFSRADRDEHVRRVAYMAGRLAWHGVFVITALISPYRSVRDEARAEIARFLEVHVRCDLAECIRRDVKGLYHRALAGEIPNFTGISDPYEPPRAAEVVVDTDRESPRDSLDRILAGLVRHGYLEPGTLPAHAG